MLYSWRKSWSWAQAARWRVLRHRRSEGISSIQLSESSRYWGLQGQRAVSRGQEGGPTGGEGQGLGAGGPCPQEAPEEQVTRGPRNSLPLEVIGGPIQTHDQILFPRFQVEAARGSN